MTKNILTPLSQIEQVLAQLQTLQMTVNQLQPLLDLLKGQDAPETDARSLIRIILDIQMMMEENLPLTHEIKDTLSAIKDEQQKQSKQIQFLMEQLFGAHVVEDQVGSSR